MLVWGAVWGAVLGLLWPGHAQGLELVFGAALGALAGHTLKLSVQRLVADTVNRRVQALAGPAARVAAPVSAVPAQPAPPPVPEIDAGLPAQTPAAAASPVATAAPSPAVPIPVAPGVPRAPAPAVTPNAAERLLAAARAWLLGGNTIVRMGLVVLFVGLAFLAKYAVDNALLPPELRLAAVGAAGIALLVGGWRLGRKAQQRAYALSLQGAGVAVLYLAVFAAFRLYQFLPAGAAFVVLGMVCALSAVIALAQNALPMAFIGFAGGFAAPLLVSTGNGNHVGLFGYYLLLGVAIAAIAWLRAWRPLNLLGFVATFAVATAWGVLKYQPQHYASSQPFLVAFLLVYVLAAVLYGLRHGLAAKRAVDGTLVFGVPLVGFGLQVGLVRELPFGAAFSALALSAFYLLLAAWLLRRAARDDQGQDHPARWLAECFAVLGVGFLTLAVPLALDARWTSAAWAVEGAAVYWMGRRQGRWLARATGLALQVLAAAAYLQGLDSTNRAPWPLANPAFLGAAMLAAAAFALAWWSRDAQARTPASPNDARLQALESRLGPLLFWAGFLWVQFGLHEDLHRVADDALPMDWYVLPGALRIHLALLGWVGTAFALHLLALPARRRPWSLAATPAWTVLPVLGLGSTLTAALHPHVFVQGGWAVWPLLLVLHAVLVRRLDSGAPARWWPWVHAGGVWLLVLLAGSALGAAIRGAQLGGTAWATVILLTAGTVALLLLCHPAWHAAQPRQWPLDRYARSYAWLAAMPLAIAVATGALLVAVRSSGSARPLPYLPLLNPTDLAVALALASCAFWLLRIERGIHAGSLGGMARGARLVLGALAFIGLNTVWLRTVHHYGGVPWDDRQLFQSFLVQAGFSILWTVLALGLMLVAFRRRQRKTWVTGAALLGVTVAKLFLVDLSNRGGSERIVVFIAVGVLMLVVGYFAPLPPPSNEPAQPDKVPA